MGAVIRVGRTGDLRRIVGVVPDVKYRELIDAPEPQVYVPLSQWPLREVFGLIRVRGDGPFDNSIRQAVLAADASEPVNRIHTMDELIHRQTAPLRILAGYTGAMGAAALFLAAIGLYGSIAYAVARRTREIGIRMALGARAEDVVKMAADGLGRLILWGVTPGLLMAILLGKALSAVLVGVSASDWRVYGAAAAALLAVALVAAAGPVRRAMRISPVEALRHE